MSRTTSVLLLAVLGLLPGCSNLSPYSTLTTLDLTLAASDLVNPDLHGRPSPVVVQLIELRQGVAFEHADFFGLYGNAQQTLSKDWVNSDELELRPGDRLGLKLRIGPDSRFVGVLAAYRDLPNVQWRLLIPLTVQQRNRADLVLDQTGIRVAGSLAGLEAQ